MKEIALTGAGLAKRVIQVHAVDASAHRVTDHALSRNKFLCALPVQGAKLAV